MSTGLDNSVFGDSSKTEDVVSVEGTDGSCSAAGPVSFCRILEA